MISLGLVGKNIQQSKSPVIYAKLLNKKIDYNLFDFQSEDFIPTLEVLFNKVDGLSITAPYKRHFFKEVILEDSIKDLNAINCIKKNNNKFIATNTDYLAIKSLLPIMLNLNQLKSVIILGDGVMAQLFSYYLKNNKIPFNLIARSSGVDLENLSIIDKKNLIINCCAKSFTFKGKINSDSTYWNLNYDQTDQQKRIVEQNANYVDGISFLEFQAREALNFWQIS